MKAEDSEAAVQPRTDSAPLLIAIGIEKAFDRTRALAGAELDVYPGEVMGLLGANGAGKSTLSKVISGHVARDAGSITLQGRPLNLRAAREAIEYGITMVMQETSLAPDLSVLENRISSGARPAGNTFVPPAEAAGGRNSGPAWSKRNVTFGSRGSPSLRGPTPTSRDRKSAGTEFHPDHFR